MTSPLSRIKRGVEINPLRISLYGVDGIGKTTFASEAPNNVFICAESGLGTLDVQRFPDIHTYGDIMSCIGDLYEHEHQFKTLTIDSADWMEEVINRSICTEANVPSIESIPYGKGHVMAGERFMDILRGCDALWRHKGMNIIIISHSQLKPFNDPENETYDRYQLKLGKANEPKLREWCDINLFANYDTSIKKVGDGMQTQKRAVSFGKRYLYTTRTAAYDAKNRYSLPARIPLEWAAFWDAYQNSINKSTGETENV